MEEFKKTVWDIAGTGVAVGCACIGIGFGLRCVVRMVRSVVREIKGQNSFSMTLGPADGADDGKEQTKDE